MSSWSDLLEALENDEGSIEELVARRRGPGLQDTLRRCAVVRSFDQALFDAELAKGVDDAPSFEKLVGSSTVEPVPRREGTYRVTAAARAELWREWWPAASPVAPNQLPDDLRELLERLATRFSGLALLEVNACLDAAEAAKQFTALYAERDRAFDLPGCQDLIDILAAPERALVIDSTLHKLRADHQAYLRARSQWSTEYYRTAHYLEPKGLQARYEALLTGTATTRAIHLHARGGRGKSMQLQWLIARRLVPDAALGAWAGGRVLCGTVDFDFIDAVAATTHPWLVLVELARQLNDELPSRPFTTFVDDLRFALPLLSTNAPEEEREAAEQKLRSPMEMVTKAPERFAAILQSATGTRPVVVVLDTLEEIHLRPDGDLRALLEMLGRLLASAGNVRLILAGRYRVTKILGDVADLLPAFEEYEVKRFTAAQATQYLKTIRGLTDAPVNRAIVAKANGDPFLLGLLADAAQEQPEITPEEIAKHPADLVYLIRRVVTRVREPGVRWLLRYGVVPRILTLAFVRDVMEPYLRAAMAGAATLDAPAQDEYEFAEAGVTSQVFPTDVLGDPNDPLDLERLWEELRRYAGATSWVSPVSGGALRFRAEVVNPMRRVIGEHPVYAQLHRDAVAYYEGKAAGDPSRWAEWTRDAIYHSFQVEGPHAVHVWRAALKEAGGSPERRASIAAEILGREYLDEHGDPLPWTDGRPLLSTGTLLDARAEQAVALAERARRRGVGPGDPVWSDVEKAFARLDPMGHGDDPRVAFVRGALELRRERYREAAATAGDALGRKLTPGDRVRLEVLLADARLLLGDRAGAADGYRRALETGERLATPPDWLPSIRRNAMAVAAAVDALDEALQEYERARASADDPEEVAELDGIAAGICLRCGAVSQAERLAAQALAGGVESAHAVRVRAASVRYEPLSALELLGPTAESDAGAEALELVGETTAELLDHGRATEALELARRRADGAGDLEAVVRCANTLAVFELREIGDLNAARYLLDEAERVSLPLLAGPKLRSDLLRAELEDRAGNRDEATRLLRAHRKMLVEFDASPRRHVAAAVATLAHAHPDQHAAALDALLDAVRRISPAAARTVSLAGIHSVPALPHLAGDPRLLAVREALGTAATWSLPGPDRAILSLVLADLDRVLGDRDGMAMHLEAAAHGLAASPSSFWLRAVTQVASGAQTALPEGPDRFEAEFAPYPLLCAAFMVERAEATRRRGAPADKWLAAAERHLTASPKPTQWHLRWMRLARPEMRSQAARIANQLGLPVQALAPPDARDSAFSELRRGRRTLRLQRYGDDGAPVHLTFAPGGRDIAPDDADHVLAQIRAMWEDGLKLPEVPAVSSPDSELRLQIRPRTLEAVPWEFILAGGGRRGGAVVIRSSHDAAAEQDEVAFVQAALARATGTGLVIDGRLGPATDAALREFQAHEGLAADGVLREDVLTRLQARGSRPEVVLVQASASAQYGDSRGHISSGADLARQYDYAGFRVQLFEAPSVHEVRAVVEAARPAVLHIAGELRETSAGIEFRFEAGARFKRGPNDVEGFSVTTVDAILNEVPFAVERPLVVLDVDHPYSEPEVLPQLMLRNEFAAGVFSLGHCPAVLATGLAGARAYRLYEALTDGLARNRSVAGIAAEMQGQLPYDQYEPGGPATALFTNLPWLRPSRA